MTRGCRCSSWILAARTQRIVELSQRVQDSVQLKLCLSQLVCHKLPNNWLYQIYSTTENYLHYYNYYSYIEHPTCAGTGDKHEQLEDVDEVDKTQSHTLTESES